MAVTAESQLVVSFGVGKRPHEQPRAWVHDPKQRLRPGSLPALCTEADAGDASASLAAFGRRVRAADRPSPASSVEEWALGGAVELLSEACQLKQRPGDARAPSQSSDGGTVTDPMWTARAWLLWPVLGGQG